jgi:non-ribosomal peptide synthetase component E (peptide arylation enzyme)
VNSPLGGILLLSPEFVETPSRTEQLVDRTVLDNATIVEKICAAVVFADKPLTLTELNDYLDQRGVASHARPGVLIEMAALPTTAVGKVDKTAIARHLQS